MTRWRATLVWLVLAVVVTPLTGCLEAALAKWDALLDDEPPSTSTGSSSSTGAPEVEPTGAIQTVTGGGTTASPVADTTDTTSSTGEPGEPLVIEHFELVPSTLSKPGLAGVVFKVSSNVTSAALYLGGTLVAQGHPEYLVYTFEATSEDANGEYDFKLLALGEGGPVEATAHLSVALPKRGSLRCPFQDEAGAVHSEITGVALGEHVIAAVGERNKGAGSRLSVWLIDREQCDKIWQRPLDMWTQLPGVKDLPSRGVAVALDESGNLVIAGNIVEDTGTRPYLALMRSDGVLLWETIGELGDEAAGVTRVPWPYEHIVMVGSRRTNLDPPRYDGLIKGYAKTGAAWKDIIQAPLAADEEADEKNHRSEKLLAVDFHPDTLELLVVGEREFRPLDGSVIFPRTFTARYAPLGGRLGTWTSTGDYFSHDSARSLRSCGDVFLAGGWTRAVEPGAKPQPLVRRLDAEGKSVGLRAEPFIDAMLYGVDCDREKAIVGAGVLSDGLQTDALIYARKHPEQPPVWKVEYDGQSKGNDRALALDCDAWGYCAWGGYETLDGKPRAIVQLRFP